MTLNIKPYRQRVEVVIWKRSKILVTINPAEDGSVWYGLPGGGIDDGEDLEKAIVRETLEEVGVVVKDLKHTGIMGQTEKYNSSANPHREEKYRGSQTHLFAADYDKRDMSIMLTSKDAVDTVWMSARIAHELFKKHFLKSGGSGDHSFRYLEAFL